MKCFVLPSSVSIIRTCGSSALYSATMTHFSHENVFRRLQHHDQILVVIIIIMMIIIIVLPLSTTSLYHLQSSLSSFSSSLHFVGIPLQSSACLIFLKPSDSFLTLISTKQLVSALKLFRVQFPQEQMI